MTGADVWLGAAIAEQEEHLKRSRSCCDVLGQPHAFRACGRPSEKSVWSECVVCGVTATKDDYGRKLLRVSP